MPDPTPSLMEQLTAAAKAFAERKLGRNRLAVQVNVRLDGNLELEAASVELLAPVAVEGGGRLSDSFRDVVVLLATTGHRLTTSQVLSGLDKQGTTWGENTIRTMLAQAIRDELLDNRPDAKPPGYGLPSWPKVKPADK